MEHGRIRYDTTERGGSGRGRARTDNEEGVEQTSHTDERLFARRCVTYIVSEDEGGSGNGPGGGGSGGEGDYIQHSQLTPIRSDQGDGEEEEEEEEEGLNSHHMNCPRYVGGRGGMNLRKEAS